MRRPSYWNPNPSIGVVEYLQPYPEIDEYTAVFMDGRKVKRTIQSLDPSLLFRGHVLRKLIFRFVPPPPHPYYYPYAIHTLVLEKDSYGYFHIHFYHYYNVKNERIEIPIEQQFYDVCALDQFLYQHPVFYHALYGRIIRPSFLSVYSCSIPSASSISVADDQ